MQHVSKERWEEVEQLDWSRLANERAPDYGEWLSFGVIKSSGRNDLIDGMPRTLTVRKMVTKENKQEVLEEARYVQATPQLARLAAILSSAYARGGDVPTRMKLDEELYGQEIVGGYLGKLIRIIIEAIPDREEDRDGYQD